MFLRNRGKQLCEANLLMRVPTNRQPSQSLCQGRSGSCGSGTLTDHDPDPGPGVLPYVICLGELYLPV